MTEKTYLPHQQRVIEEKRELDEKIKELQDFMWSERYEQLEISAHYLFRAQREAMKEYSHILGFRIAAFETHYATL